ncbi:PAS domain-containing protein [Hymenobacter humi]|uniref:PAS domain-containing protein n=1 Tax=Hymenobacter humi TaxID=1411620 RepID=A0ABW2UAW5_9BACT
MAGSTRCTAPARPFGPTRCSCRLDRGNANPAELEKRYYNFIYQARHNASGAIDGIIVFAFEVTDQVVAREQLTATERANALINQELAAANEELQVANEEIRSSNDDLFRAKLRLRELNQELEARVHDRTARLQQAQAETERQRARLERFFMQAPAAICILDGPEPGVRAGEPRLPGPVSEPRAPGPAHSRGLARNRRPRSVPHVPGGLQHRPDPRRSQHADSLARPEDGVLENRYFDYIQQARFDEAGRIDGVLVFAFEVTEQVEARRRADALQAAALEASEQAVQQRETLYQVFEQTPASVAILRGPEHRFEYLNPGYQALFPGRQLLGLPLAEALPETVEFGFLALLDQVYTTGEPFFGAELPLQSRDAAGNLLPEAFFTFTYQAYHDGGAVVGVSIFAFDVTEQVLARQQTIVLQEEVRQRDAQLQALFEQAPVAIAVLRGPEFVVELANDGMAALWGHTREEVLGKPLLQGMPEIRGQGFEQLLAGVMSSGEAFVAQEQAVELLRHGQARNPVCELCVPAPAQQRRPDYGRGRGSHRRERAGGRPPGSWPGPMPK